MENNKEKKSKKISNATKWGIFVAIFLSVLVIMTTINIIGEMKNTDIPVASGITNVLSKSDENAQVIARIESLEQVNSKTEEELKKINEKEMAEAEKREKEKQQENEKNTENKEKNETKNTITNKENKTTTNKTTNTTTNKKNTVKQKKKYYIKVNYKAQVVNVYTYDDNGKYTVPVKAFVCSTGTETPRSRCIQNTCKNNMVPYVWRCLGSLL